MFLADRLTLDARRRTKDGYMAVRAKAARTGVYAYLGSEIDPNNEHDLRDAGTINVLRDDQTVFDAAAARSFIGKPITDDHPKDAITAANWKDHARGMVMGAMRDGDYLAFDLLLTDADTIKKVDDGKRELSNGYAAELEFGDFEAPDGTKCAARQVKISGNHVALVDRGRAGEECRIADAASCDSIPRAELAQLLDHIIGDGQTYSDLDGDDKKPKSNARREPSGPGGGGSPTQDGDYTMPHVLIIDGLQVPNVSDEAKAAIEKLQGQVSDANTRADKAEASVAALTTDKATLEGEKAALEQKVKDAQLTPAQLEKLVADRSALITQAKAIDPKVVTDGKSEAEIRAAVVQAKLGDDAMKLDDEAAVAGAFAVLAKDTKPADALRDTLKDGVKPTATGRAAVEDRRKAWLADKGTAYRQPAAQGAK